MAENVRLSVRMRDLHSSPIRETLSVIDKPGMISFAGGLPSSETFPTMDSIPEDWMQYGASEGEKDLRTCIARRLGASGLSCSPEQVLILSGSQQGIDLVAKLFIDSSTPVAVESPTYLAALQVFRFFGARMVSIDLRHPERSILSKDRPAIAYVIPTFQNPTGHCYSSPERDALARQCDEAGVPVFEDDPYRDLVYDDCNRTPVCAMIKRAPWIYLGSFSKILAPGLRLGFLVASTDLMPYLIRLKQAADLHSNRLGQRFVLDQLQSPQFEKRIERIAAFYRSKRDAFGESLSRHLGGVDLLFLTHADDVADHAKFQKHFGCRRIIHETDASGVPAEILLKGEEPVRLDEDVTLVPVPGYTEGSVCLIFREIYLFSGDHLSWSPERKGLQAFRRACWHSWKNQISSMERLARFPFEWVLPGHGARCHFPRQRMTEEIALCIAGMKTA
ncbi:MAG: aminotransferase class I/II-fold pyridoxal phosphate-dependent enzyme [Leptospirillum sp.]|jgi:histidinol-phosphate/aromatic aminotransferase/cobyric acid decarboxylase-like protein